MGPITDHVDTEEAAQPSQALPSVTASGKLIGSMMLHRISWSAPMHYRLPWNCSGIVWRLCEFSRIQMCLSSHSTTPTPTSSPASSRGSLRECRRVVQLATGITSIARVGRVGEDPREEVGVGVGVVECELYTAAEICFFHFDNLPALTLSQIFGQS